MLHPAKYCLQDIVQKQDIVCHRVLCDGEAGIVFWISYYCLLIEQLSVKLAKKLIFLYHQANTIHLADPNQGFTMASNCNGRCEIPLVLLPDQQCCQSEFFDGFSNHCVVRQQPKAIKGLQAVETLGGHFEWGEDYHNGFWSRKLKAFGKQGSCVGHMTNVQMSRWCQYWITIQSHLPEWVQDEGKAVNRELEIRLGSQAQTLKLRDLKDRE